MSEEPVIGTLSIKEGQFVDLEINCPKCEKKEREYHSLTYEGKFTDAKTQEELDLYGCQWCGFQLLVKLPDEHLEL